MVMVLQLLPITIHCNPFRLNQCYIVNCTVVSSNRTLAEDKMRTFSFSKRPIYTHDGASANFSTNHTKWITVHCNLFRLN
jgi:hypothetical protein